MKSAREMNHEEIKDKKFLGESESVVAIDSDEGSDIESENCIGSISNFKFSGSSPIEQSRKNSNEKETFRINDSLQFSKPIQEDVKKPDKSMVFKIINQVEFPSDYNRKHNVLLTNKSSCLTNRINKNSISKNKLERFNQFAKRMNINIQKTENKRKLITKMLEEEELRECTFSPKIIRSSSIRNFHKSEDYIFHIFRKEKFKFTQRLKNDIKCLNSMKLKPSIHRNNKVSNKNSCLKKGFEKVSCIKKLIKENTINFPFKPTIHTYFKGQSNNNKDLKSQNNSITKEQNIYNEKQKFEKYLRKAREKIDDLNDKLANKKFEKEISRILIELDNFGEDITKDEMICLLSKLSFISNSMSFDDQNLLNKLWEISLGNQKEKAKLGNIKLILYAVTGIIKPSIFNQNSLKNHSDYCLVFEEDKYNLVKQLEISKKEVIEIPFNEDEINNKKKSFLYDENGRLIINQKEIYFLRKLFISFYCKRFCLKGKNNVNQNFNDYPKQFSKLDSSISSKQSSSKKNIPFINKRLYKTKTKSISRNSLTSDFKKNELINQLSAITPISIIKKSESQSNI